MKENNVYKLNLFIFRDFSVIKQITIKLTTIFKSIFEKQNIYICNSIDCKSDKKIIGNVSTPTLPRSFLGCINLTGRCLGNITPSSTQEYVLKYLKENQIKQGENKEF